MVPFFTAQSTANNDPSFTKDLLTISGSAATVPERSSLAPMLLPLVALSIIKRHAMLAVRVERTESDPSGRFSLDDITCNSTNSPSAAASHGKVVNRSLRSVSFAASPNKGVTLKISSIVRKVEPWV